MPQNEYQYCCSGDLSEVARTISEYLVQSWDLAAKGRPMKVGFLYVTDLSNSVQFME